jgi:hypothetical protein
VETLGWRAVLFLALLGMLFSHIFAVLAIPGLLAAEAWRSLQRRRLDWPVAAALLLPLAALVSYGPMLRGHGASIYPPAFQPDGEAIFDFYIALVSRVAVALGLTALAVLLLLGVRHLRGAAGRAGGWFFTAPEWIAAIWMMFAPLLLMTYLMATHGAFFNRYGAVDLGAGSAGRPGSAAGLRDRAADVRIVAGGTETDRGAQSGADVCQFRAAAETLPGVPADGCARSSDSAGGCERADVPGDESS